MGAEYEAIVLLSFDEAGNTKIQTFESVPSPTNPTIRQEKRSEQRVSKAGKQLIPQVLEVVESITMVVRYTDLSMYKNAGWQLSPLPLT